MARKKIELYNFDKYQPHLPNPSVDRIDGNADEMVLSADGYEQSASGGVAGSLSLNANGGVWTDTGPGVTCDVSSRAVMTTDTTTSGVETFLTFNKSAFRAADVHAIIQSGNVFIKQPMEVIHNGTVAAITTHAATVAGSNPPTVSYTAEISSGDVILKISGVSPNTTITCVVRYTLI